MSIIGCFSTNLVKKVLMENVIDSSHLWESGDWSSLWRIHVPSKTKMLLWRAMRNCIPIRVVSWLGNFNLDQWQHIKDDSKHTSTTSTDAPASELTWVPPTEGHYKCNTTRSLALHSVFMTLRDHSLRRKP